MHLHVGRGILRMFVIPNTTYELAVRAAVLFLLMLGHLYLESLRMVATMNAAYELAGHAMSMPLTLDHLDRPILRIFATINIADEVWLCHNISGIEQGADVRLAEL